MAGQKVQRSSAVNDKQPMVVWSGALEMDRSKLDPFSATTPASFFRSGGATAVYSSLCIC